MAMLLSSLHASRPSCHATRKIKTHCINHSSQPASWFSSRRHSCPAKLVHQRNGLLNFHNGASSSIGRRRVRISATSLENDADYEACVAPMVSVDNDSSPKYTKLTVEVMDFAGLLRVISWVLNGLGLRVQNAICQVDDEGFATDELWITDLKGRKLTPGATADLLERIHDNVAICIPRKRDSEQQEFEFGNILVSNTAHPKYTKMVIKGEPSKPGFLLELSSVVTGVGLDIHGAVIQTEDLDKEPFLSIPGHNFEEHGRVFQFLLSDKDGSKLDYNQISALLYTLQLVVGLDSSPVTAPNITFKR